MFKKSKLHHNKGTINQELLQRIDKINDEKEYNPYTAIKKATVSQDELFKEEDYEEEKGDYVYTIERGKKINLWPLFVFIFVVGTFGGIIYLLVNFINTL